MDLSVDGIYCLLFIMLSNRVDWSLPLLFEVMKNMLLFLGYVNAVDIPEGAMNVLVKEVKPCASFLGK